MIGQKKFYYTDDNDNPTTPEKAHRITLLKYDKNEKICERLDWLRDSSGVCKNCDTEYEVATTFEREDGIIAMKKFIQKLLHDFKNKDNQYHDRRDLSQTLLNAIKTLDDSLDRLYSTPCNCKECRREDRNDKR